MLLTVYGIKNCNTVKSALSWLTANAIDYQFHDFKGKGISDEKLKDWCAQVGWENLLNTRGTTWRQLPPEERNISSTSAAIRLMKEKTSIIRRPVIESGDQIVTIGFDTDVYDARLRKR